MIVLDTYIISELLSPLPQPAVVDWLADQSPAAIFTTTVTEAEILYGLRLLPDGRRRANLRRLSYRSSPKISPVVCCRSIGRPQTSTVQLQRKDARQVARSANSMPRLRPLRFLAAPRWQLETLPTSRA
jgi:hypothetical protein